MFKILFSVLLVVFSLSGASLSKPTGCDLSQEGDVSLSIQGYKSTPKADYKAAKKVGKNFKELFVGSTITLDAAQLRIVSVDANKRIKGQPRTGYLGVEFQQGKHKEYIEMSYAYNKGYFQAWGKQKSGEKLSFTLKIKALLCYSK